MNKITLGVLFGGVSSEHDISTVSAKGILSAIDKEKYNLVLLGITKEGRWFLFDDDIDLLPEDRWLTSPSLVPAWISPDRSVHGVVTAKGDTIRLDTVFPVLHGKNGEDGTVTFPVINYTKAGEYKYTIVEKKGDLSHVTYDATVHHAVVKVMDNAGKLDAAVTYDGDKANAPTFTNTYTAKGSVELTATKTIKVADGFDHTTKPADGEFTFDLKDAAGNVIATAKNDANGKVSFTREFQLSDLDGAASKDFTYTIAEKPGAEAGMVYDNHTLTYTVTVTDGGNGALNAKAIVTSASGSDTFTNTYQPGPRCAEELCEEGRQHADRPQGRRVHLRCVRGQPDG